MSSSSIKFFILALLLAGCSGEQQVISEIMVSKDGYAIHGYDAVSYFTDTIPQKGKPEFSAEWKRATWLFSSAENMELFLKMPEQYAPQYGGWCAYGMAEGYAAETDPLNAWTVHEGKLYLNWDTEVSRDWKQDLNAYLLKSEDNWPGVRGQLHKGEATVYWK